LGVILFLALPLIDAITIASDNFRYRRQSRPLVTVPRRSPAKSLKADCRRSVAMHRRHE